MPLVPEPHSVARRQPGPVATFLTRDEAEAELEAVLEDEPAWLPDLWVEGRPSSSSASSEWAARTGRAGVAPLGRRRFWGHP